MAVEISVDDPIVRDSEEEEEGEPLLFQHLGHLGIARMKPTEPPFQVIQTELLKGMGFVKERVEILAIYRKMIATPLDECRLHCHAQYRRAIKLKTGIDCINLGFYGSCRSRICEIMEHGFACYDRYPHVNEPFGHGVYFSTSRFCVDELVYAIPDSDGVRHFLICLLALGRPEVPSSWQKFPSSGMFDHGVNSLTSSLRRFIMWEAYANSFILPLYIVSFRIQPFAAVNQMDEDFIKERERFFLLTSIFSRLLRSATFSNVSKAFSDFTDRKIAAEDLMKKIKETAGEDSWDEAVSIYHCLKWN